MAPTLASRRGVRRGTPLGFPVLGAVAGTVGCLAAVAGRLLVTDPATGYHRVLRARRDPACPACGPCASLEEDGCRRRTAAGAPPSPGGHLGEKAAPALEVGSA